jgi:hypothetical protein
MIVFNKWLKNAVFRAQLVLPKGEQLELHEQGKKRQRISLFAMPFYSKECSFTQTGSGQTY